MAFKAIIAGGGTGGHLFPAVALGEQIRRTRPDSEVLFVGATNGIEARWFPGKGLRYELLEVRGFIGKSAFTRLGALMDFLRALRRARKLLQTFHPNIVISAGGYASAPLAVAAIIRRTPLVLLEQNSRPGLVTRLLWRFAARVCLGFADAATAFGGSEKVAVTGNPLRLSKIPQPAQPHFGLLRVLVLGGSSGAHRLNLGVLHAVRLLSDQGIQLAITHQTGEADLAMVRQAYEALACEAKAVSFIDDMAAALDAADLVIARAGAMTVSEIALAGRPAIFVPYPFHRDRQQEHNARVLVRAGGAWLVSDDLKLGENLAAAVKRLNESRETLVEMGSRARRLAIADSAQRIAHLCFELTASEPGINQRPAASPV
jgi:UDP-N-acetylglucosamine--N-acetylmuramyl-(pentapeptide) pyrophosphoryl-undecaprenol N-acetylglucosamine transferase